MADQDDDNRNAILRLRRAVVARPHDEAALDELCARLLRSGQGLEATEVAAEAAAARPHSANARFNLGVALETLGRDAEAGACFQATVELDPASVTAWLKLANILRRLGQFDAALRCASHCVSLAPDHHGARVICGLIRDAQGSSKDADEDFSAAVRLCPQEADALNFLGVICIEQGRLALAETILRRAVVLGPDRAEPQGNLGLALQRQGRLKEAFDAYVNAVGKNPTHVIAQCNLGGLLLEIGEYDAAISACRIAARLDPACLQAQVYAGIGLRRRGRSAEAIVAFRAALEHAPAAGDALIELCDLRLHICDWAGLEIERDAILSQIRDAGKRVPPFQVLGLTGSAADHRQAARAWAATLRRKTAPLAVYEPRSSTARAGRLRIGYLSADFRTHATAMLIAELLERHDRGAFEIVGYSCGADDASPMRRRLIDAMDRFIDIRPLSHHDAARAIHADGIDILIDLKGYTRDARPEILAHRPASIQVNYLGFPGTMGTPFIDYIIADRIVAPPEHAGFFDEHLVHLPHSYQPNDSRRAVAAHRPNRAACGLPENGFVFCCLNGTYKITPDIFDVWMRLLGSEPRSVLWLFEGEAPASENLRREAAARGIAPERLVFAPKVLPEDHLARLALADLFLDTLTINAHTTASEALWVGVPVVTVMGEAFVSRVAGSLLHALGLSDLVTSSLSEYEALAARLARDGDLLRQIRARLLQARDTAPLFDTPRYTRNFEAALLHMATLRDAGRPPQAFAVVEPPLGNAHG